MVEIQPFCALRFQPKKIPDLSRILCPPYDVISPESRRQIARLHPYNAVQLELPHPSGMRNRYRQAAALLRRWQRLGVLAQDPTPALYFYEQTFLLDGKAYSRRGFFCALRVEEPWTGGIAPHERTLPKPRADRLRLYRAVKTHISPVFGVVADPRGALIGYLNQLATGPADGRRLLLDVNDPLDRQITHRLWRVAGEEEIEALQQFLRPPEIAKPVMIADGHHRYETAWTYAQERTRQARHLKGARWIAASSGPPAFHYVLTFLCSIADPGVVILSTHRALEEDPWRGAWRRALAKAGALHEFSSIAGLRAAIDHVPSKHRWIGLFRRGDGQERWYLLTAPRRAGPLAAATTREDLEVVWLHERLLQGRVPPDRFSYGRDAGALVREVRVHGRGVVFMLPPPRKELVMQLATSGATQCLPPKSTYFYPKLATGLVMLPLDGPLHPS